MKKGEIVMKRDTNAIVRNYKIIMHARKLKVQAITSILVEMEDISIEKVALILCKLYEEEIDDVIIEVCKKRQNLLFLVVLEIAKILRYKIFRSRLLRHIDEGTDQEFLSEYEKGVLMRTSVNIEPSHPWISDRQADDDESIYRSIKRAMTPTAADIIIEKIQNPNVSTEQAAQIIKSFLEENENSIVNLRSLLNMEMLSLSASDSEEERQLAAKIDAALDTIKDKEMIIRPVNDFKD